MTKQKRTAEIRVADFFPCTKQEELACDLNGQKLAAMVGYSPARMLTLLDEIVVETLERTPRAQTPWSTRSLA